MSNFRRQDKWRQHPLLTNGVKDAFPGFKRAAAIFAVYVVLEQTYKFTTSAFGGDHSDHHHSSSHETKEWKRQGLGLAPQLESSNGKEAHHH